MAHHGGDVCGGSHVGAQRNSRTIPTVEYQRGGSFFVPTRTLIPTKTLAPSYPQRPWGAELIEAIHFFPNFKIENVYSALI